MNLILVLTILVSFTWNPYNVPLLLAMDPILVSGPFLLLTLTYMWVRLMCSAASWHVGRPIAALEGFLSRSPGPQVQQLHDDEAAGAADGKRAASGGGKRRRS